MSWRVILELPATPQRPAGVRRVLSDGVMRREHAEALASRWAHHCRFEAGIPDGRVLTQRVESSDQLQVTRGGVVLRDQPHLPAIGQDVTIIAPPAVRRMG